MSSVPVCLGEGLSQRVAEWVEEARAELDAGEPAFALVLGRELHWLDDDRYRTVSLELLTAAYEALNRRALAEVARVHHAHRDLSFVSVFEASPESSRT